MEKQKRDRLFLASMICLCAVLVTACVVLGVVSAKDAPMPEATPQPVLNPIVHTTPKPTPEPTPEPMPEPTPTPIPYDPPPELTAAQHVNPHVIAWLEIPGTEIRYPVLQHPTEDNHYLDITIEGGYGYPGSIYTNSMEGRDFDTFNTVIYGHNMGNGTYFGSLKNYHERSFLNTHREIDIYTPTAEYVYDIFAVVVYDDRYITDFYDDSKPGDRAAFLRSLTETGAMILDDVPVSPDGHIITLSTCIADMPLNRLLIVAARRETEPAATTT